MLGVKETFGLVTDKNRPEYVMVIGIPCSGKSTLYSTKYSSYVRLSSDDYIEQECAKLGITYGEGFKKFVGKASDNMDKVRQYALDHNLNIFHDQTNVSKKSRVEKISKIPNHYKKIALVVSTTWDKVLARNAQRQKQSSVAKFIPINVLQSMKQNYEIPTQAEGFDEIIFVET